jgi:arabinose-5-phosphate isomerase
LAVCLLEAKDFKPEDFAKYHPGGALGKQLYLKVDDIYKNHQLPMVGPNAGLEEIIFEISAKRLGATAVWDESTRLLGMVTDGDLRRLMQKGLHKEPLKASEIMSTNPITIEIGEFAVKALQIMQERNITQLIVTENGQPKGFVHLHDLLKEGII